MNQSNYLSKLLGMFVILLSVSIYMFTNVSYSISHTNTKQNFIYEGASSQTTISNYYFSKSDFVGDGMIQLNEAVELDFVKVIFEDEKEIKHQVEKIDDLNYVMNVKKASQSTKPTQIVLYAQNEVYDVIKVNSTSKPMYSFTDGTQTYRHLYFGQSGVFLGEFCIDELPENLNEHILVEFCHKDENSSMGYHVFAKKEIPLFDFVSEEDLGYVPYLEKKYFDETKDVYVIVSWNDHYVVEMPLIRGTN